MSFWKTYDVYPQSSYARVSLKELRRNSSFCAKSEDHWFNEFQLLLSRTQVNKYHSRTSINIIYFLRLVIETLNEVDKSRKCFRMIGGVLVERNVGEVLPSLVVNRDQLMSAIEVLKKQVTEKGQEINEYKEEHKIKIKGIDDIPKEKKESPQATQGVLVQSKS
nr:EOG090X0L97 [Artemia franciscana]